MHFPQSFRRRRSPSVAVIALVTLFSACNFFSAPARLDGLSAFARDQRIWLVNQTSSPVFTIVLGRNAAAYTDWAACVDRSECPPISPRAQRDVPYPLASHGVPEHEALVYWWHATLGSDGVMKPGSIRVAIVQL